MKNYKKQNYVFKLSGNSAGNLIIQKLLLFEEWPDSKKKKKTPLVIIIVEYPSYCDSFGEIPVLSTVVTTPDVGASLSSSSSETPRVRITV